VPNGAAPEREVARRRKAPGERRGPFQIGEEDRRGPPAGLRDPAHSLDVPEVGGEGHRGEHRHAGGGLGDQRGAGEPAVRLIRSQPTVGR